MTEETVCRQGLDARNTALTMDRNGRVWLTRREQRRCLIQVEEGQAIYRLPDGLSYVDLVIGSAEVVDGQVIITLPL